MGSCFLSMLEKQASLLNVAAEIMAPLGSYKEVGSVDSHSDSAVRDATLQWLSAAQVLAHSNHKQFMHKHSILWLSPTLNRHAAKVCEQRIVSVCKF